MILLTITAALSAIAGFVLGMRFDSPVDLARWLWRKMQATITRIRGQ